MNLYLIYLATLISTYSFNTYNYIKNRIRINKLKNRNLIYKKNLSSDSKFSVFEAEIIPALYYLGASLLSLVPIYNVFVPEKFKNVYNDSEMELLALEYIKIANEQEIIQRYANGVTIQMMDKLGFVVPEKYKVVKTKPDDIKINDNLAEEINKVITNMFTMIDSEDIRIDNIDPISNKEFKKRERKILRLSNDKSIDDEKIKKLL